MIEEYAFNRLKTVERVKYTTSRIYGAEDYEYSCKTECKCSQSFRDRNTARMSIPIEDMGHEVVSPHSLFQSCELMMTFL